MNGWSKGPHVRFRGIGNESGKPGEVGPLETGMGLVDRAVQYRDSDARVTDRLTP